MASLAGVEPQMVDDLHNLATTFGALSALTERFLGHLSEFQSDVAKLAAGLDMPVRYKQVYVLDLSQAHLTTLIRRGDVLLLR